MEQIYCAFFEIQNVAKLIIFRLEKLVPDALPRHPPDPLKKSGLDPLRMSGFMRWVGAPRNFHKISRVDPLPKPTQKSRQNPLILSGSDPLFLSGFGGCLGSASGTNFLRQKNDDFVSSSSSIEAQQIHVESYSKMGHPEAVHRDRPTHFFRVGQTSGGISL